MKPIKPFLIVIIVALTLSTILTALEYYSQSADAPLIDIKISTRETFQLIFGIIVLISAIISMALLNKDNASKTLSIFILLGVLLIAIFQIVLYLIYKNHITVSSFTIKLFSVLPLITDIILVPSIAGVGYLIAKY